MIAKITVVLSTLAVFATAAPGAAPQVNAKQCNTGNSQCCNQVQSVQQAHAAGLFNNIIGLDIGSLTGLVGAQCTPITGIGASLPVNCAQQPVCCQNNNFNGLINVGCSPISV